MKQHPNRAGEMAALVRVVESGSFAGAARHLELTPSAVSKLMTRLENRLGAQLLRRSTRRIALTPEGEVFHRRSVAILADIDAADLEAGGSARPAGRVRINSSASYVAHVLAGILPNFLARFPEINVDIVQTDTVADLLGEAGDLAIRAGELPASGLIARSLGRTRFVVAAAPSWIARHGTPRSIEDLIKSDQVGLAYHRSSGEWLPRRETMPDRVRVSDGEGVRRLALAGVGPARLAEFSIREDLRLGRLVPLLHGALPDTHEAFHAVYVGHAGRLPARVRALLDFLAAHGQVT
jgi:DNA-binding transcriptional LysR family regulator